MQQTLQNHVQGHILPAVPAGWVSGLVGDIFPGFVSEAEAVEDIQMLPAGLFQNLGRLCCDIRIPVKGFLGHSFLELQITRWPAAAEDMSQSGKDLTQHPQCPPRPEGGMGPVPQKKMPFRQLAVRYFLTMGVNISCSHSMNNPLVTHSFTEALYVTGIWPCSRSAP